MTNRVIGIHVLAANNTAPVFSQAVPDRVINVGVNLAVTNTATDAEAPPQTLTFRLTSSPLNALLNTNNGIVTWRPQVTQAGTTNVFAVVVTDNGTPNLSATQSFKVTVNPLAQPGIGLLSLTGTRFGFSVSGQTGPDYAVQVSSNLLSWDILFITNSPAMPFSWTNQDTSAQPAQFYRIKVGPPLP
jgi:hypothetical protein